MKEYILFCGFKKLSAGTNISTLVPFMRAFYRENILYIFLDNAYQPVTTSLLLQDSNTQIL